MCRDVSLLESLFLHYKLHFSFLVPCCSLLNQNMSIPNRVRQLMYKDDFLPEFLFFRYKSHFSSLVPHYNLPNIDKSLLDYLIHLMYMDVFLLIHVYIYNIALDKHYLLSYNFLLYMLLLLF